jgi:hypothetical protein
LAGAPRATGPSAANDGSAKAVKHAIAKSVVDNRMMDPANGKLRIGAFAGSVLHNVARLPGVGLV